MNRLQRSDWSVECSSNKSEQDDSDDRKSSSGSGFTCSLCCHGFIIGALCCGIALAIVLTLWLTSSIKTKNTSGTTELAGVSLSSTPVATTSFTVATTTLVATTIMTTKTSTTTTQTSTTSTATSTSATTKTSTTSTATSTSATTKTSTTSTATSTSATTKTSTTSTATSTSATTKTSTTSTATSTSATTKTSTTTTESSTTSTTTTESSTTSTTTVTSTTTETSTATLISVPVCNSTCGNISSVASVSFLAQWKFDNTLADTMSAHHGTGINGAGMTLGYINEALSLNVSSNQYVSSSFIPLNSRSFTIDGWIYPTGFPNAQGFHSIVGLCPQQTIQKCLQVGLRSNTSTNSSILYFDFWEAANLRAVTPIKLNRWTHIALVYAKSSPRQSIYINGVYDNTRTGSNGLIATSGTFYIGNNDGITSDPSFGVNSFQGYIDQLTITNGIRSSCEILNVATMAARFSFDDPSNILSDSGPNNVSANAYEYSSVNGSKGTNGISFNNSLSSYMNASGFRFFSYDNSSFSISLWIQPNILHGNILNSSIGYSLYFESNGSLISKIRNISIEYNTPIDLSPQWSHIALTWSSLNGIQLYLNNQRIGSANLSSIIGSGFISNDFILGGRTFAGSFDEWRIYSRELTKDDICALFVG